MKTAIFLPSDLIIDGVQFLKELSCKLNLPIIETYNWEEFEHCFQWNEGKKRITLVDNSTYSTPGVYFDLVSEYQYHLRKNYSLKKEPLAKALGLSKNKDQLIFDATCGSGKDALLMLSFGARVKAFERSPIVAALIYDALRVCAGHPEISDHFKDRFEFVNDDFIALDFSKETRPDVVYLDPMYPEKKKKSALPRKEMVLFRKIVGDDADSNELFEVALKLATKRVVVKRALHAPLLANNPTATYKGKSTRYDMYQIHS
jgi:16S rRNA (guanine1516-N2)-methyltransferase